MCKQIKVTQTAASLYKRDGKEDRMDKDFKEYHRGEIYFANLNPIYGSEQGGIRFISVYE